MPDYKSNNHEEAFVVESKPLHSTFQDSTPESSPEPQTPKEEEIQPSEFPFSLEEDFLKILETPRTISTKRDQQFPITPSNPHEEKFLKETIKVLTSIYIDEWLREVELSPKVI
jgi:hypothetical protein